MSCGKIYGIPKDVVILGTGLVLVSAYKPPQTAFDIGLYIVGGLAGYKLIHADCWNRLNVSMSMPMPSGCGCK